MRYSALALTAACWLVCNWTTIGFAQRSDESGPPKVPPPPGSEGRWREKFLESLPPEMRARFEAAREKAMQDPKLRELRRIAARANRDFFKAMREKMMEIDPALAEMVRKRFLERKARRAWKDEEGTPGFDSLNQEEREKFLSALEKTRDDPAVQAAREKRWDAISAEERAVAAEQYRKAMAEAMVKEDPSLIPILDKLNANRSSPTTPAKPEKSDTVEEPQLR